MLAPLSYQVLGWREFNTSFLFIGIAVEVGFTVNNLQLERKSDTLILCQSRYPFKIGLLFFQIIVVFLILMKLSAVFSDRALLRAALMMETAACFAAMLFVPNTPESKNLCAKHIKAAVVYRAMIHKLFQEKVMPVGS